VAAYSKIIPENMMSLIVNANEDLNAIYMGAINETAYDGEFVWVNMATNDPQTADG
jgi:hypothetical protein